jgi:hypothetical protein
MSQDVVTAMMNQFLIETHYPSIDEFEVLFQNKGPDDSEGKSTINGYQFDVTKRIEKDFNHVSKWIEAKCRISKIPIKNLKINMSWCIDYNDGGYQALHCHGQQALSVVFHLDDQPKPTYDSEDVLDTETRQTTYGMLYSIIPRPDGTQLLQNHIPKRGQCLILDGKVFHGVYPVRQPRRSVVIDYDYEWLEPEEKL